MVIDPEKGEARKVEGGAATSLITLPNLGIGCNSCANPQHQLRSLS